MPTPTYIALSNTVLGSATASVTFSSISQTYTDLILIARFTTAVNNRSLFMQFNSDTGANYSDALLQRDVATAGNANSQNETNNTFLRICGWNGGAGTTSDAPGFVIVHINNYTSTSQYKTALSQYTTLSDTNYMDTGWTISQWRNTAAVSTITLYNTNNTNYNTGSRFTLYGIKAE